MPAVQVSPSWLLLLGFLRCRCLHLLALGPRSLGDLHKAMRAAQQQQQLSGVALDTALLKQTLAQVGELKASDRYHLRPEKLQEATEGWAHYTAAQRSTLRALRAQASGAVASARASSTASSGGASASVSAEAPAARSSAVAENSGRAPPVGGEHVNGVDTGVKPARSTNGVAEPPRITSVEEYKRQKAVFNVKYKKYEQLDKELAAHTAHFEQLKSQYDRASPSKRSVLAKKIEADFSERSKEMTRQTEEYRALHVELKAIKAAVQRFVSET
uniref:OCEL domain-containing protein n=1 Tax=Chrysotila carterae TaxID=13221 RepID=A0A7S4B0S2_CHRCT